MTILQSNDYIYQTHAHVSTCTNTLKAHSLIVYMNN